MLPVIMGWYESQAQLLSLNLPTFYQSDENLERTKGRLTVRRVVMQYELGFGETKLLLAHCITGGAYFFYWLIWI
jgi:hypothetical protein